MNRLGIQIQGNALADATCVHLHMRSESEDEFICPLMYETKHVHTMFVECMYASIACI